LTIWAPESDDHSESHCAARPTAARYRLSRFNALWKRYKSANKKKRRCAVGPMDLPRLNVDK
jgi:hypothetical protein